jgi:hypothetical protein
MRSTVAEIANALAWAVLLVLVGVAILIADLLGFAGLFILGMFTWVICTQVELGDDTPTRAHGLGAVAGAPSRGARGAAGPAVSAAILSLVRDWADGGRCGRVRLAAFCSGIVHLSDVSWFAADRA